MFRGWEKESDQPISGECKSDTGTSNYEYFFYRNKQDDHLTDLMLFRKNVQV